MVILDEEAHIVGRSWCVKFQNRFWTGVNPMSVGPGGAALIWLELLLPTHWPILIAALGTAFYARKLRSKGKFFLVAWITGYGVQGLVSVPWPLIWMMFFDKQSAPQKLAVFYIYIQSFVSVLLTLWAMHVIATKYWHRIDS